MRDCIRVFGVLLLVFSTAPAGAQSVAGEWTLEACIELPAQDPEGPVPSQAIACDGDCFFSGSAVISQQGSSFQGNATLEKVSGSDDCPSTLTGLIDGTIDGNDIGGTISDQQLGMLGFKGQLIGAVAVNSAAVPEIDGDFETSSGPFAGSTGSFLAMLRQPVPAQPRLALGVLALLLLGLGGYLLYRRRTHASAG